jgi:hypothetical protein
MPNQLPEGSTFVRTQRALRVTLAIDGACVGAIFVYAVSRSHDAEQGTVGAGATAFGFAGVALAGWLIAFLAVDLLRRDGRHGAPTARSRIRGVRLALTGMTLNTIGCLLILLLPTAGSITAMGSSWHADDQVVGLSLLVGGDILSGVYFVLFTRLRPDGDERRGR